MYVKSTDAEKNTVTLGRNEELFSHVVFGENLNWIAGALPEVPVPVTARVRYHGKDQPAMLHFLENGLSCFMMETKCWAVRRSPAANKNNPPMRAWPESAGHLQL